jgi:hypothetical protein
MSNDNQAIYWRKHVCRIYVAQQSVTKFIIANVVIWSHFLLLLKLDISI